MKHALAILFAGISLGGGLQAAEVGSIKVDLIDLATGATAGTVQVQVHKDGVDVTVRVKDGVPETDYATGARGGPGTEGLSFITIIFPATSDSHGRFKVTFHLEFTAEEIADLGWMRVTAFADNGAQNLAALVQFQ